MKEKPTFRPLVPLFFFLPAEFFVKSEYIRSQFLLVVTENFKKFYRPEAEV